MVQVSLRVGIVGAGAVVRGYHLPALSANPSIEVAWIADPRPGAAAEAAGEAAGEPAQLETAEPPFGGTDAVLIATPPATHRDLAVEALGAGCHVMCEKPLALTVAECEDIAEAAAGAGGIASVAFNQRRHPAVRALRDGIGAGALGEPRAVRSVSLSPGRESDSEWLGDPAQGGDVLFEVGVHHADLWRFLLSSDLAEAGGVARGAIASIGALTASDVSVSAQFGWGVGVVNRIEVYGSEATGSADLYSADAMRLIPASATGSEPGQRARRAGRAITGAPALARSAMSGGAFRQTFASQWEAFVAAIEGRGPNPAPPAEGVAAARAIALMQEGLKLPAGVRAG